MKHIRLLLYILFLIPCCLASAQSLSVVGFRLLDDDGSAKANGTMKFDQNGDVAALIKVVTTEQDFSFDVGIMGVVATSQKQGEIWVYVPSGVQRITITHSDLGVLRDYYFPVPIEGGRTYELKLTSGRVSTIVEESITSQYVVFQVEPKSAVVYIDDDEPRSLDSDGMLSIRLQHGAHTYKVTAPSFLSESGSVDVQSERVAKQIILESAKAKLTVNTLPDAKIIISNHSYKNNTIELDPGVYVVEVSKNSYKTVKQEITLAPKEELTLKLEPVPVYGSLKIESNPPKGKVYLDGKIKGKTPLIINDVLVGDHYVRVKKKKLEVKEQKVIVKEDTQILQTYDLLKDEHSYVDLGLSVKWATCNIGANSPEESGYYYAWGETGTKNDFSLLSYKFVKASNGEMTKYYDEESVLKKKDDVASVIWRGRWRMPTKAEFVELISDCTWTWTTMNGVKGYKISGKKNGYTDNYIFLPVTSPGDYITYWSSSLAAERIAYFLRQQKVISGNRFSGYTVRPVHP